MGRLAWRVHWTGRGERTGGGQTALSLDVRQAAGAGLGHVDGTLTARTSGLWRHHPHLLTTTVLDLHHVPILQGQAGPDVAASHHLLLLHGEPLLHHVLRHLSPSTPLLLSWHPLDRPYHGRTSRSWRPLDMNHPRRNIPSLPPTGRRSGSGHSGARTHRSHSASHHPSTLLTL